MSSNKLVYIASPYAGDAEQDARFVRVVCRYAIGQGATSITVHLLRPWFLDDDIHTEREVGLQMGLQVLEACGELWVCGMHISKGMEAEIFTTGQMEIPVCRLPNISLEMPEQNYAIVAGC